jgi:hypothetical protein
MTFFNNPLSHGHDVSIFGTMQWQMLFLVCMPNKKSHIASNIKIFSAPLFDERCQNDKMRTERPAQHYQQQRGL